MKPWREEADINHWRSEIEVVSLLDVDETSFFETHTGQQSVRPATKVQDPVMSYLQLVVFSPSNRRAMCFECIERSSRDLKPLLQPFAHALARAQHPNAIALAQVTKDGQEGFLWDEVHGVNG